ncbi:MAG TPA: hypothetical protein VKD66_04580 [Streptosporangiaceae bacterium]|nr:hypothetical protein [Streptosporangiaceae bacterium]
MRSVSFLAAAAVIGLSALTAACGQQAAGPAATGSPGTGAPPVAACGSATPTSPPHRILTLGTADSGGSFCVKQGTGVLIYLRGTPAAKWAALRSSSAAMVPRANGHLMLALGVTGGYFVATRPGVAAITSSRDPCGSGGKPHPPAGPTTSNQAKSDQTKLECADAQTQTFRVTVRVVS